MHILLLNYEYPPLGGGAGIVSQQLAAEFINSGIPVTIITTWFEGLKEVETHGLLTIYRLKSLRKKTFQSNPIEMLSWCYHCILFLKKNKITTPNTVCLTNFLIPGGIVGYWLKRTTGVSFHVVSHGHDIPWFSPKQMWWYHFLLYPVLFFLGKKAKSIIHLSTPLKKNADNFLGKKNKQKNIVIPNGISKNEIINTPKPTNTIIKALFVGRLVDQKDPLSAIKAMSILAKKNIQISLTIIGDGELKKEIENYVSANNLSSVILLGKLDRETVLKKMSEADLLIAPSREEAMSIAILEAIAQKLFVITTPAADLEKLIATYNCGAYVPLSNPTAIADAIQSFRENIFNKKPVISNENYQNFIDNYCWENIAAQYIATLSKN